MNFVFIFLLLFVLCCCLSFEKKRDFYEIIPFLLLTFLNAVIQGFLLFYIHQIGQEDPELEPGAKEPNQWLAVVAIFVYTAVTLSDLYESLMMVLYLYFFPSGKTNEYLKLEVKEI